MTPATTTSPLEAFGLVPSRAPVSEDGPEDSFLPRSPEEWGDTGIPLAEVEGLILKQLFQQGERSGRDIAQQLKVPMQLVSNVLARLKAQMYVAYKSNIPPNDYEYELREPGIVRHRRLMERSTYCGAMPVGIDEYRKAMLRQSLKGKSPSVEDVKRAFSDMMLEPSLLARIGQAIASGRSMFLFGLPGNGKTSIAERAMRAIDEPIWIPRTISAGGEVIRLFDPLVHREDPLPDSVLEAIPGGVDRRWVRIQRPTIVVGGELGLHHLELTRNDVTGVSEAPIQLKANCGCMVVDDLGRQRISHRELLNRWILPMEKGYDFLNLSSGRAIQVPFDQLVVFSTNLSPLELCDDAFLRRLAYKIEIPSPNEQQYRMLFAATAESLGLPPDPEAVDHLIRRLKTMGQPLRYCHAKDLLTQVVDFCTFFRRPLELTARTLDLALANYFCQK